MLSADSTAHTWKPTFYVDPSSTDAPYSSYVANPAQLSDNNAVCLSGCTDTKTCPGVYDNALNDLGDTPFFVYVLRCQK